MRIYPKNENQDYWDKNKLTILHPTYKCCGSATVLFKASAGGFVKHICLDCKKTRTISFQDISELPINIKCPECNRSMEPNTLPNKNYGFVCTLCQIGIQLSDLLNDIDEIQSKQTSKSSPVLSQCVNCIKFGTNSCPGPSFSIGKFQQKNYFCGSYSPVSILRNK